MHPQMKQNLATMAHLRSHKPLFLPTIIGTGVPPGTPCIYTGCFTTCGHYRRRWFPRSLWSKKFI